MEAKWFVYIGDHAEGPFTPEQIARGLRDGKLAPGFLSWTRGMKDWLPLEEIDELRSRLLSPSAGPATGGKRVGTLTEMMGLPRSSEERSDWIGPAERARALAEAERVLARMDTERRRRESSDLRADLGRQLRALLWAIFASACVGGLFGGSWLYFTRDSSDSPLRSWVATEGGAYPILTEWIEPLPRLPVWSADDRARLLAAVRKPFGPGAAQAAWTVENPSSSAPVLWFATNLPLQTRVRVRVEGIRGTLEDRISVTQEDVFWFSRPWSEAKIGSDRAGFSLSRGIYSVSLRLDGEQLPGIRERLSLAGYRPGMELVQGQSFLGGLQNDEYRRARDEFNRQAREKMAAELSTLQRILTLASEQMADSRAVAELERKRARSKNKEELNARMAERLEQLREALTQLESQPPQFFQSWAQELKRIKSAETVTAAADLPEWIQEFGGRIEQKKQEITASAGLPAP